MGVIIMLWDDNKSIPSHKQNLVYILVLRRVYNVLKSLINKVLMLNDILKLGKMLCKTIKSRQSYIVFFLL